jgi:tetratricopeptide (TPR) repeat protein
MDAKAMSNAKTAKGGVLGLLFLTVIALVMCAVAAFTSGGPTDSPYIEDWLDWARLEPTASGMMLLGVVCAVIGIIGTFVRLLTPSAKRSIPATAVMSKSLKAAKPNRVTLDDGPVAAPVVAAPEVAVAIPEIVPAIVSEITPEMASEPAVIDMPASAVPVMAPQVSERPVNLTQPKSTVQPLRPDFSRRGALKFDAASLGIVNESVETATISAESLAQTVAELTPSVPTTAETASADAEVADAAQTQTTVTEEPRYSAEIITLRPQPAPADPAPVAAEAVAAHEAHEETVAQAEPLSDPIAAALLADVPELAPRAPTQSDINAVISSAMRFIETPTPEVEVTHEALHRAMTEDAGLPVAEASSWTITHQAETLTEIAPSQETLIKATTQSLPEASAETRISAAVDKSLALWPQTTRPIAADELKVRAAYLAQHPSPEVRAIFDLLAEGNVEVAASCLQTLANAKAFAGDALEAAELWRVFGALNMGRDDPKAMMAYEQVSALDPSDANIHLYLSRRYAMEGKTDLMLPVLSRALMVISDAYTRIELLGHYGDLALKAGMLDASAQAYDELSQLQSAQGAANPDNLQLRSAHAISVAKMAQVRELQGQIPQAAPLYRQAYKLLADLSARVPDHAGLRAMTANALKDATRLNA